MATKTTSNKSSVKPAAAKKSAITKAAKPAAAKKASTRKAEKVKRVHSHEEISRKAHEIYLDRLAKGEPGDPDGDWHKAVDQL
jgi:hypothetical protein